MVEVLVVACTLLSLMVLVLALVLNAQTQHLRTIAREVPQLTEALVKYRMAYVSRDTSKLMRHSRTSIIEPPAS